jgi:hypothetical protein
MKPESTAMKPGVCSDREEYWARTGRRWSHTISTWINQARRGNRSKFYGDRFGVEDIKL